MSDQIQDVPNVSVDSTIMVSEGDTDGVFTESEGMDRVTDPSEIPVVLPVTLHMAVTTGAGGSFVQFDPETFAAINAQLAAQRAVRTPPAPPAPVLIRKPVPEPTGSQVDDPVVESQSVPEEYIPQYGEPGYMPDEPVVESLAASTPTTPTLPYLPQGFVIDWIDANQLMSVQIQKKSNGYIYNPATKTFAHESLVADNGLMQMVRDTSIRQAFQFLEVQTPPAVWTDGGYRVFIFDATKTLVDMFCVQVYKGVPFYPLDSPFNAHPTPADIVIKLLDNTTLSLHNKPNTPGFALNKVAAV